MSGATSFQKSIEQVRADLKDASDGLRQREKLLLTNSNTTRVEALIKRKISTIAIELDYLSQLCSEHPARQLKDLEEQLKAIEIKASFNKSTPALELTETQPDRPDFSKLSTSELKQSQLQARESQDIMLDSINDQVLSLKDAGRNIGEELDIHIKLLNEVDQNVEVKTRKMDKVKARIETIIEKSSDCCMLLLISGLVVLLVLLILYA